MLIELKSKKLGFFFLFKLNKRILIKELWLKKQLNLETMEMLLHSKTLFWPMQKVSSCVKKQKTIIPILVLKTLTLASTSS